MKNIKEKRGITLVALAVTIVVLLLLSAVTITFVLGEDGIINKAKEAANSMNNAFANDQASLDSLFNELNSVVGGMEENTLVSMFKKAQKEGCMNLDGKCSDPTHLHIGDYVDYKNPTNGSYTVLANKSGVAYNQTYNVAENQLNWRVLGIDETTGGIKLVAGSPAKRTIKNGITTGSPYFDIKGAEGYVYAPDEMNKIGELYKNNYAQTARSINMNDINQALGIKTEEQIKSKNVLPSLDGVKQYGEKYGPYVNQWTPEDWLKPEQPKTTVEGTVNSYAFLIGSEGIPQEISDIAINIENTRLKNMLFNNVELRTGKAYWLASRGAYARSDYNCAYFGPGIVGSRDGMIMAGFGGDTFNSDGREYVYSGSAAVCPVVSLKSNITKDEIKRIPDKTEEIWNNPV